MNSSALLVISLALASGTALAQEVGAPLPGTPSTPFTPGQTPAIPTVPTNPDPVLAPAPGGYRSGPLNTPFENLDVNRDGRLSPEELKGNAMLSNRFNSLDANRDGFLSTDEFATAGKAGVESTPLSSQLRFCCGHPLEALESPYRPLTKK